MDKKIKSIVILAITILIVSAIALIVSLTVFFELNPTIPIAKVTSNIDGYLKIGYTNNGTSPQSQYVIINGTVTNDSPNPAYNVGLNVTAWGVPKSNPYTTNQNVPLQISNIIVPISSGTYSNGMSYPLSTLPAHQSVLIDIAVVSPYNSSLVLGSPVTSVVWSNSP